MDTFFDEREESMIAAKLLGNRLYGVRLDTPSSRRGNMEAIAREVRWTLDLAGYRNVKILISGGVDEEDVIRLRDVADMFGVGTSIASHQVLILVWTLWRLMMRRVGVGYR